jgi:shikimate 5-dehydrogenase
MENKEAVEYFIEQMEIEIRGVMHKMPTKMEMRSYCDHWLNTLATVKSLNKEK